MIRCEVDHGRLVVERIDCLPAIGKFWRGAVFADRLRILHARPVFNVENGGQTILHSVIALPTKTLVLAGHSLVVE